MAQAVRNFRAGGEANERLDVQKLWLLVAFEMWRERWEHGAVFETEEAPYARAVHDQ